MGILNISPDSFYEGSRFPEAEDLLKKAELMIEEGADILDIGAVSTRPFAEEVSEQEELERLLPSLKKLRKEFPDLFISVDTWRSDIAKIVIEEGADIINDISGGCFDKKMAETIAHYKKPFVLMHTKGDPKIMQVAPSYKDVNQEIIAFFNKRIKYFYDLGVDQLILDPGFGFGKSLDHNYEIIKNLKQYQTFGLPLLAGVSRKSMVYKVLDITPSDALNGTTVLNTIALLNGANILRVHDVKAAKEAIKIVSRI
ncbi:MAG: dihydropteroate synthase [Bacteroidetes bacterium HGW-Bacteroidetes-17]|nr:MAG: dihydropteroate synthase [Bacteroidetes bacterium HGW-Bacteroidetes-17]